MAEVPTVRTEQARRRQIRDPDASRTVVQMRMVVAVIVGVSIAFLPMFGDHRVLIGLSVGVLSVAVGFHALSVLARTRRPPPMLGISDLLLVLFVMWLIPESMAVGSLIAAGSITLFVLWYGPRIAMLIGFAFEVALAAVVIVHAPPWWPAVMLAFAITTVATSIGLGTLMTTTQAAQERYISMVNGLDAVVWECDSDNKVLFVSGNVTDVLGTSGETFAHPGFYFSRIHPDDLPTLEAARSAQQRGELTETHFRVRDDDGNYRWIQERQKASLSPDGSIRLRRGLVVDESARWRAEAGLRRYMDFIEGIPVALVVLKLVDPDDPSSIEVATTNPAAEALVPADPGMRLLDVIDLTPQWLSELAEVALGGAPMERPFVNLPGSDAVFTLRAVALPEHHVGVTIEDITKRARLAESFRHQALHDELTGLPNRAHFRERLIEVMNCEDPHPSALLLVDLNQFKEINDTLGHHYGDRLLREFGQRLSTNLRGCDLIARLGGDEFAVLITDDPRETGAIEVAERLLELCNRRFNIDEFRFNIGASVGVALAPIHATNAESLLRKADTAMYWAKARGGGWSLYSAAHDDRDLRRLELMGDLREAISGGALEVHYQPRVRLADRRPVGLEALVRWRHPRYGLLPPDEFIELAEVSGCIRELTEFVTTTAIEETAPILTRQDLCLSVNLSARTLHDPRLLEWLGATFADRAMGDGRLCFEITESELMEDPMRSMEVLEVIRTLGVRFSVDDFGTGYSSLSYLRQLPVDEVKIDRSFVADVIADDTIVRAVVDLGHNLGLQVVAEGVEDQATAERLTELGCDSAQGFLWAPAVPIAEVTDQLDRLRPTRSAIT
jgi:diguanylate cyclase (GGDEF)-like protein